MTETFTTLLADRWAELKAGGETLGSAAKRGRLPLPTLHSYVSGRSVGRRLNKQRVSQLAAALDLPAEVLREAASASQLDAGDRLKSHMVTIFNRLPSEHTKRQAIRIMKEYLRAVTSDTIES